MTKVRIALAIPDITYIGGAEIVAKNLAHLLAESTQYDVTILNLFKPNKKVLNQTTDGFKIASLNIKREKGLVKRLTSCIMNRKKIVAAFNDFDFVIGNNFFRYYCYPFKCNAKLCEIQHLRYEEDGSSKTFIRNYIYKKLYKIIALTERDKKLFINANVKNTVAISNFIPIQNTHVKYDSSSKNILAIGRLTEQKNFTEMLEIWNKFDGKNNGYKLNVLGEGALRGKLELIIESYNMKDSVILHGSKENVDFYLETSCLFISTSIYEGFPLSFLEAMNYGLPILTYDFDSGAKELVEHEFNGEIVPLHDIEAFTQALSNLLSNHCKLQLYSKNTVAVRDKYSASAISNEWNYKVFANND